VEPKNPKRNFKEVSPEVDRIAREVVDSAFKIHPYFGPGLLESAYEVCLAEEMGRRRLKVERQVAVPLVYHNVRLDAGYRIDLLVEKKIIVEIKTVEMLLPVHRAQILTYLKLAKLQLGFLINFNVPLLKKGLERVVLSGVGKG
jgi:GxxExxY protein